MFAAARVDGGDKRRRDLFELARAPTIAFMSHLYPRPPFARARRAARVFSINAVAVAAAAAAAATGRRRRKVFSQLFFSSVSCELELVFYSDFCLRS